MSRLDDLAITRRAALATFGAGLLTLTSARRAVALPLLDEVDPPTDSRYGALKDLDGYFPFSPPASAEAWAERAEEVRRRILVASGLWPMPTKPALVPVIHGKVDRDDYTVERVFFESFPGLYVTGSLYRPKGFEGQRPAVVSPHGHWENGRFFDHGEAAGAREIESGAEKFAKGGRHPLQARCVQLARMGCVVFLYDMLGYADSVPFTSLAHTFKEQRPELSSPDRWGIFSAQAELRCQNILGLQLWNSIRALDFVDGLPDVDSTRLGVTGASGGGTQTMLLAAVDERPKAIFPAVMVSTAMQGGCTCENASYLRVETGNIEFAALSAPRPQAMTGANDWTKEIETKGFPELKALYELVGAPGLVKAKHFPFGHNYNAVSRAMMYEFMREHLELGDVSIEEREYEPLTVEEATVWGDAFPKPPCDEDAEVRLLKTLDADSPRQALAAFRPSRVERDHFREVVGAAVETMVGRKFPEPGEIGHTVDSEEARDGYTLIRATLTREASGEIVPVLALHPTDWSGKVVAWVHPEGTASLLDFEGEPGAAAMWLLARGIAIVCADLLGTGSHRGDIDWTKSRTVDNPRQFLGYTAGYNHTLFAQRIHDILALLGFIKHHDMKPNKIAVLALSGSAKWVAPACYLAGEQVVSRLALDTGGFRFASITEIGDPDLWPGAVRYGDLPSLIALNAPIPIRVSGEQGKALPFVDANYEAAGAGKSVAFADGGVGEAVGWLLGDF
jgi:dienelactone hydrolase